MKGHSSRWNPANDPSRGVRLTAPAGISNSRGLESRSLSTLEPVSSQSHICPSSLCGYFHQPARPRPGSAGLLFGFQKPRRSFFLCSTFDKTLGCAVFLVKAPHMLCLRRMLSLPCHYDARAPSSPRHEARTPSSSSQPVTRLGGFP